jgi:Domain of unknown function (DUF397)
MSTPLQWRKSSRSDPNNCVELAWPTAAAAVRDSKNPVPTLHFTRAQFADFIDLTKARAQNPVASANSMA